MLSNLSLKRIWFSIIGENYRFFLVASALTIASIGTTRWAVIQYLTYSSHTHRNIIALLGQSNFPLNEESNQSVVSAVLNLLGRQSTAACGDPDGPDPDVCATMSKIRLSMTALSQVADLPRDRPSGRPPQQNQAIDRILEKAFQAVRPIEPTDSQAEAARETQLHTWKEHTMPHVNAILARKHSRIVPCPRSGQSPNADLEKQLSSGPVGCDATGQTVYTKLLVSSLMNGLMPYPPLSYPDALLKENDVSLLLEDVLGLVLLPD